MTAEKETILKELLYPYEFKRVFVHTSEFSKRSKAYYIYKFDEKSNNRIIIIVFNTITKLISSKAKSIKEELDKINIEKYFEMERMFHFYSEHTLDFASSNHYHYTENNSEFDEDKNILTWKNLWIIKFLKI